MRQVERDKLAQRATAIGRLSKLPPFHPTALRLLSVSTDSDSAVRDFERAFQSDPALAAHLLMVANSPLYGFRGRVDSIRHAIMLMGLEGVRSLAFTLGIGALLRGSQTTAAVRLVWNHGLATAVIAEAMGAASGHNLPFLYTAGLLHDVGRLGLLSLEGMRYAEVLDRRYFDLEESLLLEDLMFGCAHDDAGGFLARSWGFPPSLCECVRFHHHPAHQAEPDVAREIVQLACHLASTLGMPETMCEHYAAPPVDPALAARLQNVSALAPERLLTHIHLLMETLTSVNAGPRGLHLEMARLEPKAS